MYHRKTIILNNLKHLRKASGFTQKQVAELLGFTNEVSISHWEKGTNIPNIINLFKLSSLYKVTPKEMYHDLTSQIENDISKVLHGN